MSRKLWTIGITGLLLAVLFWYEQREIHALTGAASQATQEIIAAIRTGEIGTAQEKARALDLLWDERAGRLEMMVDHGSTDDVRYALSRLIAAIEGGDKTSMLIYAGELEGSVEHVYERQQVTMENLF